MAKRERYLFDSWEKIEEKNIQKTAKHFSKDLEFNKEVLNVLFDVFKSISTSYSEKWSHSKKACMFILPRLIMSNKAWLDLIIRGYYFDSIVIERSLMESTALLALFSKNEEAAEKWLNFEKLEIPKWKLIHKLHPSPTRKLIALANKAYAEQSDFVHSSFVAIITEFWRHLNTKKEKFEFLKFRKSLIGEAISTPVGALILLILIDLYQDELAKGLRMKVIDLIGEKISEWKAKNLLKN